MRHPFYVNILVLFSVITAALVAALISVGYVTGSDIRVKATATLIEQTENALERYVSERMHAGSVIEKAMAQVPEVEAALTGDPAATAVLLKSLVPVFHNFTSMTGAYIAGRDGPHLYVALLSRLPDNAASRQLAPGRAAFVVERVLPGENNHRSHWFFFDEGLQMLSRTGIEAKDINPVSMTWFQRALEQNETILTPPHIFSHSGLLGVTIATPLQSGQGVIAVNFSLGKLSNRVQDVRFSEHSTAFILGEGGRLLVSDGINTHDGRPDEDIVETARAQFESGIVGKPAIAAIGGRDHMVYVSRLLPGRGYGLFLAVTAPMDELNRDVDAMLRQSLVAAGAILLVGIILVIWISRMISAPVSALARTAERISRLEFSNDFKTRSRISEIARLADAMQRMQDGLSLFGRYVPRQLVQRIMASPEAIKLGGEHREITVMFTDVRGFTSFAEKLDSTDLLQMTSEYLEVMTECVNAHQGVVDKFIGDAVMAFWNAPDDDPDHALNACRTALDAKQALDRFNERQLAQGMPEFWTRFGLNMGVCAIGNVGSSDRMNYTPFGTVVNMASRIEGLNKHYGTQILVAEDLRKRVARWFILRPIDCVIPVGAVQPIRIYELMAARGEEGAAELEELAHRHEEAFEQAQAGDLEGALQLYTSLLKEHPQDSAIEAAVRLCRERLENPAEKGGGLAGPVTRLTSK